MINYIPKQLKSSTVTHLEIIIHLYYSANSCSTTKGKADNDLMPDLRSSQTLVWLLRTHFFFFSEMMMAA